MRMHGFVHTTSSPLWRGLLRSIVAVCAAAALSACSSMGAGDPDLVGDSADEVNWSHLRTAELETEIAALKAENAELQRQIAELRAADIEPAEVAAADSETIAVPPANAAPQLKPKALVEAPRADKALADAPAKPVEPSPRLVQPSFASEQETVFENEAETAIETASVLFGVHLASYRGENEARRGWRKLQRENPDELGLLEPRIEQIAIEGRGDFLRLIGGGFSSREKADVLCASLKQKGVFCSVTGFEGERLSLAENEG